MKLTLKNITKEQYKEWIDKYCGCMKCKECPFNYIACNNLDWLNHKDLFTNKFLNQEVEIEDKELLSKDEKNYILNLIKSIKDNVKFIEKKVIHNVTMLIIAYNQFDFIMSYNLNNKLFNNLEECKKYSLDDLNL